MKEKEIRKLDIQLRASEAEDNKMEIKGYAVVFNSQKLLLQLLLMKLICQMLF